MPIPTKNPGESKDDFISRCTSAINDEYPLNQAVAICNAQFSRYQMEEQISPEIDPAELEACMLELQGQNPSYSGAVAMKICVDRLTIVKESSEEFQKFAEYPWDECISDMRSQGYSENAANNICGAIRARKI